MKDEVVERFISSVFLSGIFVLLYIHAFYTIDADVGAISAGISIAGTGLLHMLPWPYMKWQDILSIHASFAFASTVIGLHLVCMSSFTVVGIAIVFIAIFILYRCIKEAKQRATGLATISISLS